MKKKKQIFFDDRNSFFFASAFLLQWYWPTTISKHKIRFCIFYYAADCGFLLLSTRLPSYQVLLYSRYRSQRVHIHKYLYTIKHISFHNLKLQALVCVCVCVTSKYTCSFLLYHSVYSQLNNKLNYIRI